MTGETGEGLVLGRSIGHLWRTSYELGLRNASPSVLLENMKNESGFVTKGKGEKSFAVIV
jgi:hypothetical protein